jgi:galactokinase
MLDLKQITAEFQQRFSAAPRLFSAPGRINLIGEHTDYNEGYVMPLAIDRRTYVAAAKRNDKRLRVFAGDLGQAAEFDLDPGLRPVSAGHWSNYVRGVAACLERAGHMLSGADVLISSEVPWGAGLSSSAALEAAVGYALLHLSDQTSNLLDLALILQRAEHEFAGTQCGIMDQYIACMGQAGHALLIDCRTLANEAVPLDLRAVRIVVCNSMVKHELAAGEYNTRRAECNEGVRRLAQHLPGLQSLRDVTIEEFDQVAALLPETIRRRCNHVINENERVMMAVEALRRGDLPVFGQLLYASHESLRHDYEVSCRELDLLVEIAQRTPGVYGGRMTGGGFGGCTINLVAAEQVAAFIERVEQEYPAATNLTPQCYVCLASDGVKEH